MSDPKQYPPMNRAGTVRAINDIIQERSERTIADLLDEVSQKGGEQHTSEIAQQIKDFRYQRSLLSRPYSKSSSINFSYEINDLNPERPLKVIDQQIFDRAAKAGFPPGFFRQSYFDKVTIYCMPDNADLNFSVFMDCEFAVCRIHGALFDGTSIYSSQIHNADIDHTTFFHAAIANTHFHDTTLTLVSFQKAHIVRCNTIDCTLDRVSYLNATLDGCSFGRVAATGTEGLLTAHITQGGATQEECDYNRKAIYRALSPPPSETRKPEQKRGGR